MRQLALWLGITLLPSCCVVAGASRTAAQQISTVDRLEHETVAFVHFVNDDGHEVDPDSDNAIKAQLGAYCTGVWVSPDTILTAEHCVDDIGKPKAEVPDDDTPGDDLKKLLEQLKALTGNSDWTPINQPVMYSNRDDISDKAKSYHTGKVVAVDMDNDMVLVKADSPDKNQPWASLARGPIPDGTELHIVGHPAGMWWTYRHAYVAAHRPAYVMDGKPRDILQVSGAVFFGDSGGGAFTLEGDLVGMADAIRKIPNTAIYIHRDVLRGFLEHNQVIPPQR